MLRTTLLILFIATLGPAMAQTSLPAFATSELPPANNLRSPAPEKAALSDFSFRYAQKEQEILRLIPAYHAGGTYQQAEVRKQISGLLFELLDMKIAQKEREISQLASELHLMQQQGRYQDKQAEIQQLQTALDQVSANLDYRKQNRSHIVNRRVDQLLGR